MNQSIREQSMAVWGQEWGRQGGKKFFGDHGIGSRPYLLTLRQYSLNHSLRMGAVYYTHKMYLHILN